MKKRIISIFFVLLLLLSLVGCQEEERKNGEYQIFYLNIDKTKIEPEEYDSSGATGEELIYELLDKLKSVPNDRKLRCTISESITVQGIKSNGAHLTVDFGASYYDLTVTEEVLVRAAIVRTLLQSSDYSLVAFTVDGEPLKSKSGTIVGSMNVDSFVENPGAQINTSKQVTLSLYFSNSDGTELVKESRVVHYSTNISLEKLVMEQLIEGPKSSKSLATVPATTKIITISLVEGVCYVNVDNSFQNQNQEIKEEVVLYSIVNSLTELQGVTKVQISINGDTSGKVRYTYDLSKMYEKNLDIIEESE